MKFTSSAVVLATLAVGQAAAASIAAHNHGSKHNHAQRHADMLRAQEGKREIAKRDLNVLGALDSNRLLDAVGLKFLGLNKAAPSAHSWIGSDGTWTNEFINQSGEDLVLVIWGVAGSWVNAIQPQITVSIPSGGSQTISFASGASGAWAPIYSNTKLVMGQVSETWGEFTFGEYGVVDVSREVNMSGRSMSIVGPTCTTDMNTCVFMCGDGSNTCTTGYVLKNCATGSQVGANYGTYAGAPSGGCGGMGDSAALKTYLG